MDDLGKGVGKGIGNLGSCALSTALLLTALAVVALLTLGLVTPVLGAEAKDPISTVKGKSYRMASAKMADKVTRYADPADDQLRLDGTPEPDAPAWSDLRAVYAAATRMPPKLLTKMQKSFPRGAAGAIYGDGLAPKRKDRVVFVAVQMAKAMPGDALGQQVEVGFSGNQATPVQSGTDLATWAGSERFTLAGRFGNGAYGAGATDVAGREPGLELEADEYYSARSGAFGFYSAGRSTWYLVLPRPADADAITVTVRSTTGVGNVLDRLDLPGGGHFIDLADPTGGYTGKGGAPLACRSLETFSGESGTIETLDPDSNLVRYTAGVAAGTTPARAAEMLGPAVAAAGPVSVALSAVGAEGEPQLVEGELAVSPEGNAVLLTFEAPAGQWAFALADELDLRTPAGDRIVDHATLTGPAGVQVGPGLDGYVAGDLTCAAGEVGAGAAEAAPGIAASDGEAGAPEGEAGGSETAPGSETAQGSEPPA